MRIPLDHMPALTDTQKITIAVLLAAKDVIDAQDRELEALAQRLRDAVDAGDD